MFHRLPILKLLRDGEFHVSQTLPHDCNYRDKHLTAKRLTIQPSTKHC